jgi:hypothetical protein
MRQSHRARALLLVSASVLLLGLVGCGDDDPGTPDGGNPPDLPAVLPVTPDSLMSLFSTAYAHMDLEGYAALLHEDYLFQIRSEDVLDFGLAFDQIDRDHELAVAANIFSGEPGPTSGEAGVSGIESSVLVRQGPWVPAKESAAAGAMEATYDVLLRVERPGASLLEISGQQVFRAVGVDTALSGGTTTQVWLLLGQQDMTDTHKPVEGTSWSAFKLLYMADRPGPATRDQVMNLFKTAYENRDLAAYSELLDEDYAFRYKPQDVANLGIPFESHGLAFELACTENMFSGDPNPSTEAPGISAISFDLLQPQSPWEASTDPTFPGSVRCLYAVFLRVSRPASTTIEIQGPQLFYLTQVDSMLSGGTIVPVWRVGGQVDMIAGPYKAEQGSWGALKYLYRD